MTINYRYYNTEISNEYVSFGDGYNITNIRVNFENNGRLIAEENEVVVFDILLINEFRQPLDYFIN